MLTPLNDACSDELNEAVADLSEHQDGKRNDKIINFDNFSYLDKKSEQERREMLKATFKNHDNSLFQTNTSKYNQALKGIQKSIVDFKQPESIEITWNGQKTKLARTHRNILDNIQDSIDTAKGNPYSSTWKKCYQGIIEKPLLIDFKIGDPSKEKATLIDTIKNWICEPKMDLGFGFFMPKIYTRDGEIRVSKTYSKIWNVCENAKIIGYEAAFNHIKDILCKTQLGNTFSKETWEYHCLGGEIELWDKVNDMEMLLPFSSYNIDFFTSSLFPSSFQKERNIIKCLEFKIFCMLGIENLDCNIKVSWENGKMKLSFNSSDTAEWLYQTFHCKHKFFSTRLCDEGMAIELNNERQISDFIKLCGLDPSKVYVENALSNENENNRRIEYI